MSSDGRLRRTFVLHASTDHVDIGQCGAQVRPQGSLVPSASDLRDREEWGPDLGQPKKETSGSCELARASATNRLRP